MKIDLSDYFVGNEEIHFISGKVESNLTDIDFDEFKIIKPILYTGEIYKVGYSYIINIDISFKYKSKCARCLQSTTKAMEIGLNAKLEKDSNKSRSDEGDLDIIYLENNILDLDKYILMEIASALPMRVLCNEECKGICPQCGKNLNKGSCDCEIENIDPRFEKLKDLFTD